MKKNKKTKITQSKNNQIKEYENNIISSAKNINLFNKLIESFIENIENKDEKKINDIINSFKNILTYYLMDKNIKSSNELISFFENKIELIYKILFDLISNTKSNILDESLLPIIFNVFVGLIIFVSNNKIQNLIQELVEKIMLNNIEISQNTPISFYDKFNTIFYYQHIFDSLLNIIKNKKIKNEIEFNNLYIFIINIKDLDNLLEENEINDEDKKTEINNLKDMYQNIIK